jgi:hypothetical protein
VHLSRFFPIGDPATMRCRIFLAERRWPNRSKAIVTPKDEPTGEIFRETVF